MKSLLRTHLTTILVAMVTAAITAGGPAIAATIADYAKNSDKVDGQHAVGAGASVAERAGKLVATNSDGRLPNNIITKALDANKLDGRDSTFFAGAGHDHVGQTWSSDTAARGLQVGTFAAGGIALRGATMRGGDVNAIGVEGYSASGRGVRGGSNNGTGVAGASTTGHGVYATGNGTGLGGAAVKAQALGDGIALWARTTANDAAVVIENDATSGAGADLIRGFSGGAMNYRVTRTGDTHQALGANGMVKAAVAAHCGNSLARLNRAFNNVNGGDITVRHERDGVCVLTFPFDIESRYFLATSTHQLMRGVSVGVLSARELQVNQWYTPDMTPWAGEVNVVVF